MVLKDQKVLVFYRSRSKSYFVDVDRVDLDKNSTEQVLFFQFLKKLHKNQKFTTHNIFRHVPNMGIKRDDDGGGR